MNASQTRQFEKNEVVFREGTDAKDIHVLMSGKLGIFRNRRFVKSVRGRGVFVGEMGNLLDSKRSATVITLEPSTLIVIPKGADKIFAEHAEIGIKLLESLRFRLSETYDRAVKLWDKILDTVTDMLVYELATKTAGKKGLTFAQTESTRMEAEKAVRVELRSENFEFTKLPDLLKRWDIEEEFNRHVKEKYPRFKIVDLNQMKDLWKKRMPEGTPEKYQRAIDLARGVSELTDFLTSFGVQDEETSSEEIDMLESTIPLERRIAMLKSISQNVLTPKVGIDKMKQINRDFDAEIDEAGRSEKRTGRSYPLLEFAKKLEIGSPYTEDLRKEYWGLCLKK